MTNVDLDRRWMRRALELAARGRGRTAPNPMVGAVVVRDGEVVGEGWHAEYGQPHAEVEALRAAGEAGHGATIYVTLEPCAHHGQTPPCTDAIRAAGIARLVYAASDPNPRAQGGGELLLQAGLEVTGGIEAEAARDLDPAFFHRWTDAGAARPYAALKLALSLDARIADAAGGSQWITGPEARAAVHRLRAGFDAVAVGIGTALADDPRLTVREGGIVPRRQPARVVFDRALRLPLDSALVRSTGEAQLWIVAAPGADAERRAAHEAAGARVLEAADLAGGLGALRDAGIHSLFCEGGGVLAAALLEARLVDRLHLFYAPLLLGPAARAAFPLAGSPPIADVERWRHVATETFGADTLITLARRERCSPES